MRYFFETVSDSNTLGHKFTRCQLIYTVQNLYSGLNAPEIINLYCRFGSGYRT